MCSSDLVERSPDHGNIFTQDVRLWYRHAFLRKGIGFDVVFVKSTEDTVLALDLMSCG